MMDAKQSNLSSHNVTEWHFINGFFNKGYNLGFEVIAPTRQNGFRINLI